MNFSNDQYNNIYVETDTPYFRTVSSTSGTYSGSSLTIDANGATITTQPQGVNVEEYIKSQVNKLIEEKFNELAEKMYNILKELGRIEITRDEWMSFLEENK